jgi:hypothetical protein
MAEHSYLEASRAVRETFARHVLGDVLRWAFEAGAIVTLPEDEIEDFLFSVRDRISTVDPVWAPAMEALRAVPAAPLRADLDEAFATIRTIAQAVASKASTNPARLTVQIVLPTPSSDRDGKPRWTMRGRLADALIWTALRLFSETPRSLVRTCGIPDCPRIYVGRANQKYCAPHQAEAHRQTQRQAEAAFRARKRGKKKRRG